MCGLAGFINFENDAFLAKEACSIQQHRGPDSQHWVRTDNVALSHQRLSIIDLDARSDQPFCKHDFIIIFNGEIYNYQELKEEIIRLDPATRFNTTSDTEVIVELYRLKREKCLSDLIGMFVFAIYDRQTRQLLIARDHFGIKPLFYTQIGNAFAFSSELKALVHLPGFDKTINTHALVGAVNYLWVPGNISMFKSTFKLPAAHFMLINTAEPVITPVIRPYWSLQEQRPVTDEEEATALLKTCLENSIKRHMVSDVPVSCFLSGGLDSSLISVLAARHTDRLSTYTIATSVADKKVEQMPEDEQYAKQLATKFGFDHHEIVVSPDIVHDLQSMVHTLDEPIGDPAAFNTYLICKAARDKGVKVLLSGMGADEIFFGYRRQKATLMAQRFRRLPGAVKRLIRTTVQLMPIKIGGRGIRITRWAKRFLSFAELNAEEAYMRSYSYYDLREMQQLFKGDITDPYKALREEHRACFEARYSGDIINQICHTDIHLFMQGLNLTYTDRASMAASVEVRVPFIDREVIGLAMRMAGNLKYKNKQSKYILKKMAAQYLPHEIVYRPKASFGMPIRSWIGGALKPLVDDLLSRESVEKRGIFSYPYIKKLIDADRSGKEDNAYRIYQLLTIELWFRQFCDEQ